jgi:uncharacterized protein YlxW (UPF0749 family)
MSLALLWRLATSKVGLIVLALVIGFGVGYRRATNVANAAALRAEIASLKADFEIAKHAEYEAAKQAADLEASLKNNQEKVDALLADLSKRSVARSSCALSERDARRLRNIR